MTQEQAFQGRIYRGLKLDKFQEEAVSYIDLNQSVLVSAPTGVGKTLVADYTIEKCYKEGKQVVYTAPIKALSNQKYKDFKEYFGVDAVGIITGDIVINSNAAILVMTTEIFRNMLLTKDPVIEDVRYLILDEIHYISDVDRGSVWEESIIFLPEHIQVLGLSATIPNVDELAHWITSIRGSAVNIVKHHERAVPLEHFTFEKNLGATNLKQIAKYKKHKLQELADQGLNPGRSPFGTSTHLDLVNYIKKDYLPCLYFVFSRKKCEDYAFDLAKKESLLSKDEFQRVEDYLRSKLEADMVQANRAAVQRVGRVLSRGIGYHHAGMLPIVKDVVEELLAQRLIKVLYCTETFAVGINMPVRTVCFDSNEKYDGKEFRLMSNQEYFQMAGRAGRRGIDDHGYVFSLADINYFDMDKMVKPDEDKLEDLKSQFNLGYNSVVNLIANHSSEEEIENVLQNNFAFYQMTSKSERFETRLAEVEARIGEILGKRCELHYHQSCPLEYEKHWYKLKTEKRQLNKLFASRWGRSKRYEAKRKQLAQSIKDTEKLLHGISVERCMHDQVMLCKDLKKEYNKLNEEKNQLYKVFGQLKKQTNFIKDFRLKRQLLTDLGFVEHKALTSRGRFASKVYVQELLVTELYYEGVFHDFNENEINALVACIGFEGRKNDWFKKEPVIDLDRVYYLIHSIIQKEEAFLKTNTIMFQPDVALLAYRWSDGEDFVEMRRYCNLAEGDIVSVFRRTIDLLRQIRSAAAGDYHVVEKLTNCIKRLDRDVVEVNL